jgi:hypothetical protein
LATLRAAASTANDSPDDQRVAAGRVFAHHPFVVGVGDVLGRLVFDLAARLGRIQRLVQAADPLLLEGHGVDSGDLELGLGEGESGNEQDKGCDQRDDVTAACRFNDMVFSSP